MWQSILFLIIIAYKLLIRHHADYLEQGKIEFLIADGREGLAQHGPYDIILVGGGNKDF